MREYTVIQLCFTCTSIMNVVFVSVQVHWLTYLSAIMVNLSTGSKYKSTSCTALWSTVYSSVQLFNSSVQPFTPLFNCLLICSSVQLSTHLFNCLTHLFNCLLICSTVYSSVQLFTHLFNCLTHLFNCLLIYSTV